MGTDLASDRIKLIYEYNKESSLFARVASIQLDEGKYAEAVATLNDGISKHPDYPSALFMMAIAKAYEGKEEEARESARIASELISSPKTYEYYVQRISEIISERNSISQSARTSFSEEEKTDQTELFEDKLATLAAELSKAKIIPIEDVQEIQESKSKKILSETLADIHFSQKNFSEAIAMYEELMNQKPEKAEFYLEKIAEVRIAIEAAEQKPKEKARCIF